MLHIADELPHPLLPEPFYSSWEILLVLKERNGCVNFRNIPKPRFRCKVQNAGFSPRDVNYKKLEET